MKVKIKKLHPDAIIPSYALPGDAGMDLTATSMNNMNFGNYSYVEYGTGLAIEIPEGHVGIIRPRSSVSKTTLGFSTSGVIDSGYRGEITVRFKQINEETYKHFSVGERIAQLIIIPYPNIEFEEVDELSETERGEGGHGSTGL